MPRRSVIILFILFHFPIILNAQKQPLISPANYNNLKLNEFLQQLENIEKIQLFYKENLLPDITIQFPSEDSITSVLNKQLQSYGLICSFIPPNRYFIAPKFIEPSLSSLESENTDEVTDKSGENMKNSGYISTTNQFTNQTLVLGDPDNPSGKSRVTMNGYLKNQEDGEPVIGGTIYFNELELGTITNTDGYYTIGIPKGKFSITISSIGRKEITYQLAAYGSDRIDIQLEQELISLQEVVVSAERHHNVRGTQMGFEKLSAKSIKEIPLVMGERDIVKVALLLPGVQSVGEGTAGFNVRGSPADQNIFYINHVPVYNSSHLFGFFSAFNSDAINEFSLYKSNIPINFGGRLSSIFDVKTKQGNKNNFSARGGISPITGSLMVEGPIKENKSSYLAAFRTTYSDWLLSMVNDPAIKNSKAGFRDGLVNFDTEINENNQLSLFGYYSFDQVTLNENLFNQYSSFGTSLSWNHIINNKHNLKSTIVHSGYEFEERNMEIPLIAYEHKYDLNHTEGKINLTLRPANKHQLQLGGNMIQYDFNRGSHSPYGIESVLKILDLGNEKAIESALYSGYQWDVFSFLTIYGGIRHNFYSYLGPKTGFSYAENSIPSNNTITDTIIYKKNEVIQSYQKPDLRYGFKVMLTKNLSLKASYNQLYQSIYMLSNTIAISPSDKWKLADENIKPMKGEQYSIGLYSNLQQKNIELSMEGYLKRIKRQIEYKDGAELLANKYIEWEIQQGDLDAYGLELMLRKNYGRLSGWINYTYSNAQIDMSGPNPLNTINRGIPYPANHDKPHALNLVSNYKFSRRVSISGNMVYSTGRPITYPTAIFYQNNTRIMHYSRRNEYRIPDYFRIDMSVNIEGNLLSEKLAHGSWMLSVYNLTGRKNAYSVYFKSEEGIVNGYKMSIFGRAIITLTYNFKLGNYAS